MADEADIKEKSPAEFWKESGLYDADIFDKPKQNVSTLKSNQSFLDATKLVFKMKNDKTWEQYCQEKNIDPNSDAGKDLLGEEGISIMRWFNNTTASAADLIGSGDSSVATAIQLQRSTTTNEQRAAFLYMMQAFEHTEGHLFSMGTLYGLGQGMTDASNLISIGLGAATAGAGTAATQAGAAAVRVGLKTMLVDSVKGMATRQFGKAALFAGIEGAVASGVQNTVEQKIKTQEFKLDDKAYQYQQNIGWGEVGTSTALGTAFGVGLAGGGKFLGDAYHWGRGKWSGTASNATNTATPNNTTAGNTISPTHPSGRPKSPKEIEAEIIAQKAADKAEAKALKKMDAEELAEHQRLKTIKAAHRHEVEQYVLGMPPSASASPIKRDELITNMIATFNEHGVTVDHVRLRVEDNLRKAGKVDPATGKLLNQGADTFDNSVRAFGELETQAKALKEGKTPVMVTPYETWLHKAIKADLFFQADKLYSRMFNRLDGHRGTTATGSIVKSIPTRDLFAHKFLNPIIDHVDDNVKKVELIEPILEMRRTLDQFRLRMEPTGDPTKRQEIKDQIDAALTKFSKDNRQKFADLKTALAPLNIQIKNPVIKKGGEGTGMAGLESEQIKSIKTWLDLTNRLCDEIQDPANFVRAYKANWELYNKPGLHYDAGITGAFQHYFLLGADADLNIKTRDFTGSWDPSLKNILRSKLETRIKHLDKALDKTISKAEHAYLTSPTFRSVIDNGDDGFLAGGGFYHHRPLVQNTYRRAREFKDGYFNDAIRTKPMTHTKGADTPDNVENYGIVLLTLFEDAKKDAAKKGTKVDGNALADKILGLANDSYECGREGDFSNALRRLNAQQGMDGTDYAVPKELKQKITNLKIPSAVASDAHYLNFLNYMDSVGPATNHSPEFFGRRYWAEIFEKKTRRMFGARLAPDTSLLGVPGKQDYVKFPLGDLRSTIIATMLGGKIETKEGADQFGRTRIIHDYKWKYWDKPAADASLIGKTWHYMTAHDPVLTWLATPVTAPIRLASEGKDLLFPLWEHTWRGSLLVGGASAALAIGQEKLEDQIGPVLPFNAGKSILQGERWLLNNTFLGAARLGLQAGEFAFNKIANMQIGLAGRATGLYQSPPDAGFWQTVSPDFINLNLAATVADYIRIPTNVPWVDEASAAEIKTEPGTKPGSTPDESKPEGSAQMDSSQKPEAQKPGGATSDSKKPEDEKKREKLRKELLIFGKRTADLTNEIATAGAWTDDSRKEVDKLLAQEAKLKEDINRLGLGTYALDIHQHAKNTLTYQLEPNMKTGNIPHEVSSFEQVDETRQKGEGKNVALWYNNILRLNHEVDERGWDKAGERKKRAVELNNAKAELAKNLLFLDTSVQKQYKDAEGWIGALVAASGAPADSEYAKIRRADAELLDIPDQPQDESKISGRKIQPPETKRDTQSNTGSSGDVSSPSAGNGSSPGLGGAAVTPPVSTPPASTPGPGGNTSGGQTVRVPKEEKSVGDYIDDGVDALSKGKDAFVQATGISADDPVGRMADSGINMLGAGVGAGFGMLKNTFNYLKNKKDGSGRGLLREGGALAASFLGMALLVGPAMDKMGLGNSFFKLAAFVAVYMIARKGIHTMMEETPGVMQTSGNNGQTHAALDTGGNSTVLSADKGGTHLPLARREQDAASRLMAMNNIETIPHDKPGADATVTKISNDLIRLMTQAPTPEMSPG